MGLFSREPKPFNPNDPETAKWREEHPEKTGAPEHDFVGREVGGFVADQEDVDEQDMEGMKKAA